ncbi:hypothetical protein QMK33_07240 [Hymenobacter sp. H14-R3]|uniref:hypothetical protein n=1 Tax=Hymenobacter sp. H14-R3 TaxID=3046308 RepID=UPI0024B95488|nr:hypothetical protein [Hymenobacter sp. H14-R3]MDJ0364942.1 hypothetical protein [Hymenobacter sp. H14-R3]
MLVGPASQATVSTNWQVAWPGSMQTHYQARPGKKRHLRQQGQHVGQGSSRSKYSSTDCYARLAAEPRNGLKRRLQ